MNRFGYYAWRTLGWLAFLPVTWIVRGVLFMIPEWAYGKVFNDPIETTVGNIVLITSVTGGLTTTFFMWTVVVFYVGYLPGLMTQSRIGPAIMMVLTVYPAIGLVVLKFSESWWQGTLFAAGSLAFAGGLIHSFVEINERRQPEPRWSV